MMEVGQSCLELPVPYPRHMKSSSPRMSMQDNEIIYSTFWNH
jgi:hypothetical protein